MALKGRKSSHLQTFFDLVSLTKWRQTIQATDGIHTLFVGAEEGDLVG